MKKNKNSNNESIYGELAQTLTDEEIVDAYVLRKDLSPEERQKSEAEFKR